MPLTHLPAPPKGVTARAPRALGGRAPRAAAGPRGRAPAPAPARAPNARRLAAPAAAPRIGHTLALGGQLGAAFVAAVLGHGTSAELFAVDVPQLPGRWALKAIDLPTLAEPDADGHASLAAAHAAVRQAFALQRRCMGEGVLGAMGLQLHQRRAYVLLERADGGDLEDHLQATGPLRTPTEVRARLQLFAAMARAVARCHARGVLHRDIKPANFVLARTAADLVPLLTDFGLARLHASSITGGTAAYMAPEAHRGEAAGTPADAFALGVCLYRMLVGLEPHDDDAAADVAARICQGRPSYTLADLDAVLAAAEVTAAARRALLALVAALLSPAAEDRPSARAAAQAALELLPQLP